LRVERQLNLETTMSNSGGLRSESRRFAFGLVMSVSGVRRAKAGVYPVGERPTRLSLQPEGGGTATVAHSFFIGRA
jgi:hypothetical protein